MLYGFYYHRIYGFSKGSINGHPFDLVIDFPIVDVLVTTAITGFSQGLIEGIPGSAACYIKRYGVMSTNWSGMDETVLPGEPLNNSLFISRCMQIQFRMHVAQCRAFGQATILVVSPEHYPFGGKQKRINKAFELFDDNNLLIGRKEYSLFAKNSKLDIDKDLEAYKKEISKESKIPIRKISVNQSKVDPLLRNYVMFQRLQDREIK